MPSSLFYIIASLILAVGVFCIIAAVSLTTDAIEHCKRQQTLSTDACYLELTK